MGSDFSPAHNLGVIYGSCTGRKSDHAATRGTAEASICPPNATSRCHDIGFFPS